MAKVHWDVVNRLVHNQTFTAGEAIGPMPIIWKVNCCRKRHRIALTPSGTLRFLDHPDAAAWRKVEILQAMHEQTGGKGYACRCEQVRYAWRSIFKYYNTTSLLPSSPGHTFEFDPETLELETVPGPTMRETVELLLAFREARNQLRPKKWDQSRVRETYRRKRRIRSDAFQTRRSQRNRVWSIFSAMPEVSIPLYLNQIRELRKFPGITLLSVDPETEKSWLINRTGSVRVLFFNGTLLTTPTPEWGWASQDGETWKLYADNGAVFTQKRKDNV